MADTDFSGNLYFTKLQDIALESFMTKIYTIDPESKSFFFKGATLFPIVHAEADYKKSVHLGDCLQCYLRLGKIGTSSFTYVVEFYISKDIFVGKASITHVCVNRATQEKVNIPPELKELLIGLETRCPS
ncbi:hypothetical protein COB21_00315 [Candidatus Aerophobetes bacterium]|uniref:Uncharacterized protein n=1 Tax=Aerophobetes bacterium TaxID=2030807 RepID=A0A2A4X955_UNCAE|nr:MAG: hypothetical protein COB21_00315 [Candidatus Aerophobetes bacterium]